MNTDSNKKGVFYGWVIVFAGILIMSTVIGIGWNCFGQFIKPVCADMGFTRQQMSANMTILSLMQMGINFSWGYVLRHLSLRKMMRVSAIAFPVAYYCFSLAHSLPVFYACSLVVGLTMSILTTLSFSLILSNWFYEKRGMAIGIAFMGTGIGGMIFNPLAASLIENYGWRIAYKVLAVIIFAATIVSVFFLIKLRPEEKGLKALGYEKAHREGGPAPEEEGQSFRELIKTARFRAVCLCVCFATTAIGSMTQCMSPHLTDNGYSATMAAFMVSFCMAALAVGKMSLGIVYDKLGTRRSTLLSIFCGTLGIIGMVFCRVTYVLPLIVIGQCLGSSFGTVGVPIITQNLFGRKDYSSNFGFISACSSIGGAVSPLINGAAYDRLGSYNPAFSLWVVLLVISCVVFYIVLPREKKVSQGV
ncbi:MAG: MFS transporter [Clostridiaceae bacterium]|nr:MFS transporter [Clostridiaceae bacterium]